MSILQLLFLWTAVPMFLSMLVCIALNWHIASTQLEKVWEAMVHALNTGEKLDFPRGLTSKKLMLAHLTGVLVFHKLYLRKGAITKQQLATVPASFRRKLTVLFWVEILLFSYMAMWACIIKLGWLDD